MESLKEKFNITKNSLFDWSIIEKKTNTLVLVKINILIKINC